MRHILVFLIISMFIACDSDSSDAGAAATGTPKATPVKVELSKNYSTASVVLNEGVAPNAENPSIEVTVDGLNPGMAYLIGFFQGRQYRADSVIVNPGGKMHLKQNKPYLSGLAYLVFADNSNIQILIDTDQTFKMTTKKTNLVGAMKVDGSLENELLYQNLKFEQGHRQIINDINTKRKENPAQADLFGAQRDKQLQKRTAHLESIFSKHPNSFFTSFKQSGQNPVVIDVYKEDGVTIDTARRVWLYRTTFWDNVNFNDERLIYTPVVSNKLKRYITELTAQQPDSIFSSAKLLVDKVLDKPGFFKYFANWIVIHFDPKESTLMDPQAVYVNMVENYFTPERAFWSTPAEIQALQLRAHEMSASLVGKQGPDVQSTDPTGKTRSIYELKDDYIVVYMYNPDCEHCEKETPKLVQFYHQWKPKGVDVYAIAIDTDDKKWKDYISKNKMPWVSNVHDPSNRSIYGKYFVDLTPEIYVLNPERKIIAKNLKVDQIEIMINRDKKKKKK